MRHLFVLFVLAGFVFASSSLEISCPDRNDILYEQPYPSGGATGGMHTMDPWACADCFPLDIKSEIQNLSLWLRTTSTGPPPPFTIVISIYNDASGPAGAPIWSETIPADNQTVTTVATRVYRCDIPFAAPPTLEEGVYWISWQVLGVSFPVYSATIDPAYPPDMYQWSYGSWSNVPLDTIFTLYGEATNDLATTTWADIKATF